MKDKYYYKDETSSNTRDYTKVLHRTDGPAIEYADGVKSWYIDDKSHRTDGPAVEWPNSSRAWYVDDQHYTEEDFNRLIEEVKELPLALRLIDPREWVRKL